MPRESADVTQKKHEKFCQAYVLYRNATESAKAAGYSARSAYNQGSRLLKNPEIQQRIEDLEKEMETSVNVLAEIENQYNIAKNNNHTNSALKALELLAKVKVKDEEELPATIEDLEADIIKCLETLGEVRATKLLLKCSWFQDIDDENIEEEAGAEEQEYVYEEETQDSEEEEEYTEEEIETTRQAKQLLLKKEEERIRLEKEAKKNKRAGHILRY